MAKIEVNQCAEVIKRHPEVDISTLRSIVEELNMLADASAQGDEEKPPAIKKQFVILISDPEDTLPKRDYVGWVLQIAKNESVATTQDRIYRSAYDFNASKKGRLMPIKTIGEAMESVPAKHFKDADVWVKTKTPVLMLRCDNQIPKDVNKTQKAFRDADADSIAGAIIHD